MAELEEIAARRERVRRAYEELDKEREVLSRFMFEWRELDEHFADCERRVRSRYQDLIDRERDFQQHASEHQERLAERERRVQRREEEVAAAASAAAPAPEVTLKVDVKLEEAAETTKQQQPVESSMDLDLNVAHPCTSEAASEEDKVAIRMNNFEPEEEEKVKEKRRRVEFVEVSVRPELKALCESMDGDGLRRFIVEHRKEVGVLREELPGALRCAPDPGRLVLAALEAYHPEPPSSSSSSSAGVAAQRKESEASAAGRRACILLLECLQLVYAEPAAGVDHPVVVPAGVREVAGEVARKWRSRMDIQRDAGNFLDAQAFLQLLATFDCASEYDEDELCKLISAIARRKQTPALCRAIGLEAKIPDIVSRLVEEGKQIEALSFANEFGIMDQIQPAQLLKNYLKEAQKTAQTMLKSGNKSAAAHNDSMMKEVSAIKSVIKCIEEYKLEADYPPSPLHKRISSLEKAKQDRKRTGGSVKGQAKRPRGSSNHNISTGNSNSNGFSYRSSEGVNSNGFSYRSSDSRSQFSDRNQFTNGVSGYQFVSPVAFERQSQGGYMPGYGGRNTAVSFPNSYIYPGPDGPIYGAAAGFTTTPAPAPSYPSYPTIRNNLPPPPPAYQASYMH